MSVEQSKSIQNTHSSEFSAQENLYEVDDNSVSFGVALQRELRKTTTDFTLLELVAGGYPIKRKSIVQY